MLVLSRRVGEKIILGSGPRAITITAMGINGGTMSIGIEAPKDVKILRMELVGRDRDRPPQQDTAERGGGLTNSMDDRVEDDDVVDEPDF